MKLITEIMEEKALPIVDKIYNDGFIQGLIRADLSKEAVEHYLKADALYLENFSDIYAMLLAKSNDKVEKNFFLGQINFVLNEEIAAHKNLAEDHPLKFWVEFYADGLVDEVLTEYHKIINREAEFMSEEGKQRLIKNFLESCEHERRFFNMAYTQERWDLEV